MILPDGKVPRPNHQRQSRPLRRGRLGRRVRHAHSVGGGGRPVVAVTTAATATVTVTVTTATAVPHCRRGRRLVGA